MTAISPPRIFRRRLRAMRRYWVRTAVALPAATISFLLSAAPAQADLKLCNRMSYVVEVAIGIDDKAATATRGWFRIDPAGCRDAAQGALTSNRILLTAPALADRETAPMPKSGHVSV